jgi:signal transduction histidine kinase
VIITSKAMKYSPAEQPIQVTGQRIGGRVSIMIEDHGIGIPKNDLPFLMQPFFRGQNVRNLPGTGLGLSLAGQILKLHGGNLQVRSREGHGTVVTITLPEEGVSPA